MKLKIPSTNELVWIAGIALVISLFVAWLALNNKLTVLGMEDNT